MAPRKLNLKNQKASTKDTKASTDAGVVKRRYAKVRFHENGLLNVEPKTGNARRNQRDSPLLRLPPELRYMIFEHALGGKTYEIRYDRKSVMAKNTAVSKHALALLSVCRQVFAETALLPFSSNKFSVLHPLIFNVWIESLCPVFAEVITSVRINLVPLGYTDKRLSSELTSLKFLQIAFVAKDISIEDTDTGFNEEAKEQEEKAKGLYESANSGIKVNLTQML
ncbi:hypothetical protein G6011_02149 [Alternaria panax]|uniref:2EXR domain-containing protein n=1 Tax=Alternaria panax TaxID=48097 RepID=A0AAD4FEL3_9PLEO|nr:hypothetical protein G6011_02149 [Alternaria panax]